MVLGESNFGIAAPHLVSTSSGSLVARGYDPDRAMVVGEPVRIVQQIAYSGQSAEAGFHVADRALAYRMASDSSHLIWFDRNGRELSSFRDPGDYHHPSLSPDEKHVAIEKTDPMTGRHTIWTLEFSRGITSRLVFDAAGAHNPIWSPDGASVVFGSNRHQGLDIYMIRADGTGGERLLLESPEKYLSLINDWSLDGRFLVYQSRRANLDLWILPVSPVQKARPFFESPSNERQAAFSPDGRWIAYTSDESGSQEAYIRRFPDASSKWQVSTKGGMQPRWRRDGKELFYLAPDGKLMAVEVSASPSTIETTAPRELFDTGIVASSTDRRNQYVVASDGQRFLVNISAEDENSEPITVVLNWQAMLSN